MVVVVGRGLVTSDHWQSTTRRQTGTQAVRQTNRYRQAVRQTGIGMHQTDKQLQPGSQTNRYRQTDKQLQAGSQTNRYRQAVR